jgi:hypothetical protein
VIHFVGEGVYYSIRFKYFHKQQKNNKNNQVIENRIIIKYNNLI